VIGMSGPRSLLWLLAHVLNRYVPLRWSLPGLIVLGVVLVLLVPLIVRWVGSGS